MLVFRTEVSNYTVGSGPDGPATHIRRVHFRRPDRYNFHRAIRDFACEGVNHPLTWRWPGGGRVSSAVVTRIEVHTPSGNIRYDPALGIYAPRETPRPRRSNPFDGLLNSVTASTPPTPEPIMYEDSVGRMRNAIRDRAAARGANGGNLDQHMERQREWVRYLTNVNLPTRNEYLVLVDESICDDDACSMCIERTAETLARDGYPCPYEEWEMDLFNPPFPNGFAEGIECEPVTQREPMAYEHLLRVESPF